MAVALNRTAKFYHCLLCREVKLYKIPARLTSGGHKSGEWQVSDNIFTGKLRVIAIGALCKVILEDGK